MLIGIILILITIIIGFKLPKKFRLIYNFGIFIRIIIAILNVNIGLPGSDLDARSFFESSLDINSSLGELISRDLNILTSLYEGTKSLIFFHSIVQYFSYEPSYFLGHCLSILVSGITIVIITRTYLLLEDSNIKGGNLLILIYNLSPSIITNQTYVLRECFQSFVIIYLIYFIIKREKIKENNHLKKIPIKYNILYLLTILISITLHPVFIFFTPIIIFISFSFSKNLISKKQLNKLFNLKLSKNSFKLLLLFGILVLALITLGNFSSEIQDLLNASPLRSADNYLKGTSSVEAIANYGKIFEINNPLTIFSSLIVYLVAPIGFSYRLQDLIIYPERILLIYFLINYLLSRRKIISKEIKYTDMMIISWIIINLIYSLGTSNWGTASRHQVISFSLLLIPFIYTKYNIMGSRKDKNI